MQRHVKLLSSVGVECALKPALRVLEMGFSADCIVILSLKKGLWIFQWYYDTTWWRVYILGYFRSKRSNVILCSYESMANTFLFLMRINVNNT